MLFGRELYCAAPSTVQRTTSFHIFWRGSKLLALYTLFINIKQCAALIDHANPHSPWFRKPSRSRKMILDRGSTASQTIYVLKWDYNKTSYTLDLETRRNGSTKCVIVYFLYFCSISLPPTSWGLDKEKPMQTYNKGRNETQQNWLHPPNNFYIEISVAQTSV